MVAKKAVANTLARACYHMLKEQTEFDVSRVFGLVVAMPVRQGGVWCESFTLIVTGMAH
jgi:hypothetical protein